MASHCILIAIISFQKQHMNVKSTHISTIKKVKSKFYSLSIFMEAESTMVFSNLYYDGRHRIICCIIACPNDYINHERIGWSTKAFIIWQNNGNIPVQLTLITPSNLICLRFSPKKLCSFIRPVGSSQIGFIIESFILSLKYAILQLECNIFCFVLAELTYIWSSGF